MPKVRATWEGPQGTYKDDSRRDEAPADLEEERRWKSQHHLDVLEVVSVSWRDEEGVEGVGGAVSAAAQENTVEGSKTRTLTIDVHDGYTHDAGDDNQGEASCIVIHQQQPVDACLWASGQVRQGATDQGTRYSPTPKCLASAAPPHPHISILTWLVRGMPSKKPATATPKVT